MNLIDESYREGKLYIVAIGLLWIFNSISFNTDAIEVRILR